MHHNLGSSEYPVRVQQCKQAVNCVVDYLNCTGDGSAVRSLRDVSLELLNKAYAYDWSACTTASTPTTVTVAKPLDISHCTSFPTLVHKRAKHVITENQRVLDTLIAIEQCNWKGVGDLMLQSHGSLSQDYEASVTVICGVCYTIG